MNRGGKIRTTCTSTKEGVWGGVIEQRGGVGGESLNKEGVWGGGIIEQD